MPLLFEIVTLCAGASPASVMVQSSATVFISVALADAAAAV